MNDAPLIGSMSIELLGTGMLSLLLLPSWLLTFSLLHRGSGLVEKKFSRRWCQPNHPTGSSQLVSLLLQPQIQAWTAISSPYASLEPHTVP